MILKATTSLVAGVYVLLARKGKKKKKQKVIQFLKNRKVCLFRRSSRWFRRFTFCLTCRKVQVPTAKLAEETLKFHFLKKGILSLPEGQAKLSHVTESKKQKTESKDAYRSKTLRSFNSFLKRVSKLDTTANLTV